MSTTALSGDDVLRQVYDPGSEALKVDVALNTSGAQEVIISAADDSIKSWTQDGSGNPITSTGGKLDVNATISASPGAATEAKQDVGNASLASIDSKLTSPLTVTGPLTDAQLRASAVPVSAAALPLPSGAATESTLSALNAKVTAVNTGAVVVSSSVLPSGASTAVNQATEIASLASIDSKLTSPLAVTGPLTDTQLRATAVPVSGSFFQATQPVSAASLPLPSGASTEATLSTLNGKVTAVNTGAVVVSSSALPSGAATESTLSTLNGKVTAVNTGAVVISSSALPSGAATESTLSTLNGKVTAVNTGAVVISSSALPSGAATSALQTQPGVDIGDVTINNASGASAVNIQDGGNSITVDGSLTVTPATPAAATVKQAAVSVGTTAVRCTTDGNAPSSTRVLLQFGPDIASTGKFWYGSSTVTSTSTTRGIQLFPGQVATMTNDAGEYYIISDTATQTVYVVEQE